MQINGFPKLPNIANPDTAEVTAPKGQFASLVKQYVQDTNTQQIEAGKAAVDLATGKGGNVTDTMLALQKADVSFQLMLSVRNKLVDAYREVMRMQV